jgi:pimeloyl-ACP methyl ester carboxylesterase
LDAYGVGQADIVGASMGGTIVQTVALNAPDRVDDVDHVDAARRRLHGRDHGRWRARPPRAGAKVLDLMASNAAPTTSDEERIDRAVQQWRALAGTMAPFDAEEVRERERRILARAKNIDAATNHQLAIASSPDRIDDLARITAPNLVIHGTRDPILPHAHGEATAKAIPGAKLLAIDGTGHEIPAPAIPILADAILDHTA